MDSKLISKKYVFSAMFVIDVLSTVPLDDLFNEDDSIVLQGFGMLKLIRVTRINSVIMNMNSS